MLIPIKLNVASESVGVPDSCWTDVDCLLPSVALLYCIFFLKKARERETSDYKSMHYLVQLCKVLKEWPDKIQQDQMRYEYHSIKP